MPTNAINDTGVKYLYDKLHGEIKPVAKAVSTDTSAVEGNPINFSTLSAQSAKSTILSLEPIQDLHGYSKPWVGGAGKNLYVGSPSFDGYQKLTYWSKQTGTYNGHDVYKRSAAWEGTFYRIYLSEGTYTFSVAVKTNVSTTAYLYVLNSYEEAKATVDIGQKAITTSQNWTKYSITFTVTSAGYTACRIEQGDDASDLYISEYQLEKASSATSYEPYENICPISGRTEIGILGCGKNLFDKSELVLKPWNGTTTNNQRARLEHATHLPIGTTVTIKVSDSFLTTYLYARYSMPTDYPGTEIIGDIGWINIKSNTYTTEAPYFGLVFKRIDNGNITLSDLQAMDIQLEINNAPTDYSPYTKSNDLTISLGQTVYGGTLDVENGVLVVDKKYKLYDGSSDEEWTYSSGWSKTNTNVFYSNVVVTDAYYPSEEFISITNCNCFEGVSRKSLYEADTNGVAFSGNRPTANFTVRISKSTASSLEDFKTWIASNNIEIVYILNTPITINLTPHTINLLKGVNNISTDGDKITLTYRDGSVATLEDVKNASETLEQAIADAQILTDTVTGDKYKLVVTSGVLSIEQISN